MTPRKPAISPAASAAFHPRNRHRGRYDFPALVQACPELGRVIRKNPLGEDTIDFANPDAVRLLNRALLALQYQVSGWDIPGHYLCPPIPGRADYVHYLADLLAETHGNPQKGVPPVGARIRVLDVGCGANCVYPLIGHRAYGWRFVGSDIDPLAIDTAGQILNKNDGLSEQIELRLQASKDAIFQGQIQPDDRFDLTMCNPPFHASLAEARAGSARKVNSLALNAGKRAGKPKRAKLDAKGNPALNFGGQGAELWCPGGELSFIKRMVHESARFPAQCLWFTSLVSKKENLPAIYKSLEASSVADVKTVKMSQGQKQSRFVAWTYHDATAQSQWCANRWHVGSKGAGAD